MIGAEITGHPGRREAIFSIEPFIVMASRTHGGYVRSEDGCSLIMKGTDEMLPVAVGADGYIQIARHEILPVNALNECVIYPPVAGSTGLRDVLPIYR